MKKLVYTLFFVLISVVANGQAKYVFYFIGDGMGVNQVNGTEMYQAEIKLLNRHALFYSVTTNFFMIRCCSLIWTKLFAELQKLYAAERG